MKIKISICFLFAIVSGFLLTNSIANAQGKKSKEVPQTTKQYDIAAFVWPSYHPDDRAKIFWPDGIGEWQTVISNKPKFEGHQQPFQPSGGS